jgi:transposase
VIQVVPQVRVFVAVEPVDFRRGIDGLARACREVLDADPMNGAVYVFRNRRRTAVKLLSFDGQGFWLAQKRLSEGRFRHWPTGDADGVQRELLAHELQVLLVAGDPAATGAAPQWRRIPAEPKSADPSS